MRDDAVVNWSRSGALALAAGALAASGCGDTPTATPAPTPARSSFATTEHCRQLRELPQHVAAALAGSTAESRAPERILTELQATAPAEIKADLAAVASGYAMLSKAVADASVDANTAPDPAAVERLQKALKAVDQTALTQANQDISSWVASNC
jgi:hypothetical protein